MTILVTGATGNVGRLVVDELVRAGAPVRALTTNPRKAALPKEVEVVTGYLGKVETVRPALEGVERLYLAPLLDTVGEVVALAREAGVRHIVDLSGERGGWWWPISEAVEASGIPYTHLCPGEFMGNALMWAEQIRETGVVRDGYPTSANAPIDPRDIAAVAATALLEDGHCGQTYDLTGPETLSRAEKVRLIGEALGGEIPYVEISHEEAVAQWSPSMGDFAQTYVEGMAELTAHPQQALSTVEKVTGRPGIRFAQWAAENVAEFSRT
ncbi:MAG TPA: NmrA family NAD(P)-binding protein [Actinopolymorphaceae bacterium]